MDAYDRPDAKSYIEHLVPLYLTAKSGSLLHTTTLAVSLMAFAHMTRSRPLETEAWVNYGGAIKSLREATFDPVRSRSQETLISTLLLAQSDLITATKENAYNGILHFGAAKSLADLRGSEMWAGDMIDRKLFWGSRYQAIINRLVNRQPLEPYLDRNDLWTPRQRPPPSHPGNRLTLIAERLPALRASFNSVLQEVMSTRVALEILKLMGNTRLLDQELAGWTFELPDFCRYHSAGWLDFELEDPESSPCYPGPIDTYYNIFVSNLWGNYRMYRIFCQGLIICCIKRLFPQNQWERIQEYCSAVKILQRLADEVCASVPFHIGPNHYFNSGPCENHNCKDLHPFKPDVRDRGKPMKALGGLTLQYTLFVACSVETLGDKQRAWLLGRLAEIGRRWGIGMATTLAETGREFIETNEKFVAIPELPEPPFTFRPNLQETVATAIAKDQDRRIRPINGKIEILEQWMRDFAARTWNL